MIDQTTSALVDLFEPVRRALLFIIIRVVGGGGTGNTRPVRIGASFDPDSRHRTVEG